MIHAALAFTIIIIHTMVDFVPPRVLHVNQRFTSLEKGKQEPQSCIYLPNNLPEIEKSSTTIYTTNIP